MESDNNDAVLKTETINNKTWYYIETEDQIRSIAYNDETLARNYIQQSDIELTSEWITIGDDEHPFTGIYNGNGYTISGLCYPVGEKKYTGLFGNSKGGEMYNITLLSPDTFYPRSLKFKLVYQTCQNMCLRRKLLACRSAFLCSGRIILHYIGYLINALHHLGD